MDWSNFGENFDKLQTILKKTIEKEKTDYKSEIYASYLRYHDEIKAIVQRIEVESKQFMIFTKEIFEMLKNRETEDDTSFVKKIENFILLSIDIKSFFIFTRIFLDTLARIIRLYFGKAGDELPWDMAKLVKHRTLMNLDYAFAKELRKKMSWMDTFVKKRVEIEHYLGGIHSTTTRDGKFGFDVLGSRERRSWGTDTVESITDYMGEVISNLSEVLFLIHGKFQAIT